MFSLSLEQTAKCNAQGDEKKSAYKPFIRGRKFPGNFKNLFPEIFRRVSGNSREFPVKIFIPINCTKLSVTQLILHVYINSKASMCHP